MSRLYYALRKDTLSKPPVTLTASPSEVEAKWLSAPLSPSAAGELIIAAESSVVDALWLDVGLDVFGPTEVVISAAADIVDALWQSPPISVSPATEFVITALASEVGATWVSQSFLISGPTSATLVPQASEVQARWSTVDFISMPGSGAACFTGGAYMTAPAFPTRSLTEFAISGWFQVSTIDNNTLIAKWDFSDFLEWLVFFNVSGIDFGVFSNGSVEVINHPGPVGGFLVDTWYFFYVQRTATNMQIWVG